METYRIEHYVVNVEINEAYRPGVKATVTIKSERPNAKYASVYSLLMFPDDTPKDLAQRAFCHYKMGTRPDRKDIIQRGIIDETGCARYTMTLEQLQALYKQFENFVADCPQQEYNENKSAIIAVYTLIHKHINNEIYK